MRVHRVAVEDCQDEPGGERSEDHLQPQLAGQGHQAHQQHEGTADTDLRGGVLEAHQQLRHPLDVLHAGEDERARDDRRGEDAEGHDLRCDTGAVARIDSRGISNAAENSSHQRSTGSRAPGVAGDSEQAEFVRVTR